MFFGRYNILIYSRRKKQNTYKDTFARMYFWRTQQQQEIDFVEEKDGDISAFEFKWKNKKTRLPQKFIDEYKAHGFVIDRSNFREFVKIKN